MQGSILQFAQITVDRRLRGAELRRHLADSALHIEDARLLQVVHDAYFFAIVRRSGGRTLPVTSAMAACTASGRLLTNFRRPAWGLAPDAPRRGPEAPAPSGCIWRRQVDAEHPDKLTAVLDEHGGGAQPPLGLRCTLIARNVGLLLVHPAVDEPQRHVGQRRTLVRPLMLLFTMAAMVPSSLVRSCSTTS